jgi:hypothetical protein
MHSFTSHGIAVSQRTFELVAKQTNPTTSYAALAQNIVGKKGIIGIWDGFVPVRD